MKSPAFGLIFLCLCCGSPKGKLLTDREKIALEETIDAFNQAFAVCEVQKLQQLITDNYKHTNGNNPAISRKQWLNYLNRRKAQIESGQLVVNRYELSEREIEFIGNTALLTGKVTVEGVRDSVSFSREIRISNFWVLQEGQWKRAGFHDTRIN